MECPICRTDVDNWLEHIKTRKHQNLLSHKIAVEDAQPIDERHGFILTEEGITRH